MLRHARHALRPAGSRPLHVGRRQRAGSLTIADGDTVVVHTRDVSDNQIGPDSDSSASWRASTGTASIRSPGPIYVEGAKPGDTLAVEILDLHTAGLGMDRDPARASGCWPRSSRTPYLRIFDISNGEYVPFREDIEIPLTPFFGTMGVCPAGASAQPVMPPGTFGGNMDTRQLVAGTTLVPARAGRRARCSAAVTRTAARATARSASRAWRRRCTARCASASSPAARIPAPQFRTPVPLTP